MKRVLVALFVFSGIVVAADPTGTQAGQVLPGPFSAYVVFGGPKGKQTDPVQTEERQNFADPTRAGKFHDLVTRFGLDPTIAVFTREGVPAEDAPLAKLIKSLDQTVQKNRNARLHAFVVFLNLQKEFLKDDARIPQAKSIEQLATKLDLKDTPLAMDQAESERTKSYTLNPDQLVTVIVYENLKVKARFDFTADKPFDDAALKSIEAEVNKLIKK